MCGIHLTYHKVGYTHLHWKGEGKISKVKKSRAPPMVSVDSVDAKKKFEQEEEPTAKCF